MAYLAYLAYLPYLANLAYFAYLAYLTYLACLVYLAYLAHLTNLSYLANVTYSIYVSYSATDGVADVCSMHRKAFGSNACCAPFSVPWHGSTSKLPRRRAHAPHGIHCAGPQSEARSVTISQFATGNNT